MTAFYKYIVDFRKPGSPYYKDRTQEIFFALDAADLAEQFFEKYNHVDYVIIHKEREVVND